MGPYSNEVDEISKIHMRRFICDQPKNGAHLQGFITFWLKASRTRE
jgi:hypothetical protein